MDRAGISISASPTPRLTGHLELICSADAGGRSYLSHQSFRAPFHISKPYWDKHALVVQIINPTAGLFAGDALRLDARVETGARLHLTTPSASRVHTMPASRATVEQFFQVSPGGWLEYHPALLIPQSNSRYQQRTRIELAKEGELFFIESLAPGRVAHGESFQFSEIDWACDLSYDGRLIARERFFLRPGDGSLFPLTSPFPSAYFASCYLITARIEAGHPCWDEVRTLNSPDVLIGASRLVEAGWSIKILARDSVALRGAVASLRVILSASLAPLLSIPRMP